MLCLTRKVGERFTIGDDIEVEFVEIRPHSVRLGITAPKHIPILRDDAINTLPQPQFRVLPEDTKETPQ